MEQFGEGTLFGQLALVGGLLTPEQLQELLVLQGNLNEYRHLGDLAVSKGYMSQAQLDRILDMQRRLARPKAQAPAAAPAAEPSPGPEQEWACGPAPVGADAAAAVGGATPAPLPAPAAGTSPPATPVPAASTSGDDAHPTPPASAPVAAPAPSPQPRAPGGMGGTATSRKPPQPPVAAPPHPPAHAQPPGPAPAPVARHATTGPDTSRLPRPASAAPSVRGPAIAPAPATAPAPAPATATATAPTEGQPPPPPAPEQAAAALADTLARGPVDPNRLVALLEAARRLGASDLHLQAGCKPFVRLQGEIVFLNVPPLTPQDTENLCRTALPAEKKSEFFHEQDLDFCYIADGLGRYRANLLRDAYGFGLVFRVISSKVPTLEELGLPSIVAKFTTYSQGLVLITGPSGCGKSSTMAALIDTINRDRKEHIITVEEPIEFVMTSRRCLINQREIPRDSRSYGQALRAALREDPDIIMIGELRDLETISLAITAAETGHLVLSTLHTRNATSTVDRLIDVFPPIQQPQIRAMLSVSLRGVLTQQLVRTADGRRRVAVTELLFNTPAIGNLIRDSRTFQLRSQMQTGRKLGMRLMDTSLTELVRAGVITAEAARPLAEAKAEL